MTDRDKLIKAFKMLRTLGYDAAFAGRNYRNDKFAQLTNEVVHIFDSKGKAIQRPTLKWSGDVDEILFILQTCDIRTVWNGDKKSCIEIF